MTTPMFNRMRRQTRPAEYVCAEAKGVSRPGGRSFSFYGEFPDMADQQPVEAAGRRHRSYTTANATGSYQAIGRDDARRMPPVNKYGMHLTAALVSLMALVLVLGSILLTQMDARNDAQRAVDQKRNRIGVLEVSCCQKQVEIDAQSDDVNIRQEAVRLGLISSKGVQEHYLQAPQDAVITLSSQSAIQSLASIWGQ